MALITLQAYKDLKSITDNTNDALYTTLIDIASTQIENYCDRLFNADTYYEFFNNECFSNYLTEQYPILKLMFVGSEQDALEIKNNGTVSYNINIDENHLMTITSELFVVSTFDLTLAANDTLSELKTVIEAAVTDLSVTVNSEASINSLLLKPNSYNIPKNVTANIVGAMAEDTKITIKSDRILYGISGGVIVYRAGYETIPDDLQQACANIVYDSSKVALGTVNGSIKSESITNYSYTLQDGVNYNNVIQGYITDYSSTLNYYKRISF